MKTISHAVSPNKLDLKRQLGPTYQAYKGKIQQIHVATHRFLAVDGQGDPNVSLAYAQAVEALFAVSYHLKFKIRRTQGLDYSVMPLEGLWWAEQMSRFSVERKSDWLWSMMILQPEFIDAETIKASIQSVGQEKNLPTEKLFVQEFTEGRCLQTLHLGSYAEEGTTIRHLHEEIAARRLTLRGKHHEIYLTDNRRAVPNRWKTIIRQPVE